MSFDLKTLARFLVMPGAEELLEAFSRIPPGPLRDSVVSHAQVIAQTYASAPPDQQMPDPLLMASASQDVIAAQLPRRSPAAARTPQEEAIRLRLQTSLSEQQIAERVELPLGEVMQELRNAKQAGLKFPPRKKTGAKSRKTGPAFPLTVNELSRMGMAGAMRAAGLRRITLEAYMARRKQALQMAEDGATLDQIVTATGEEQRVLSGWFSLARAAGIDVPYVHNGPQPAQDDGATQTAQLDDGPNYAAQPEDEDDEPVAEAASVVFPTPYSELSRASQTKVRNAAEADDLTPEQFQTRQRQIISRRTAGEWPKKIAEELGMTRMQVAKTIQHAREAGVEFPDIAYGRSPSKPKLKPKPAPIYTESDTQARVIEREGRITFPLFVDELTGQGRVAAEKAAAKLNATLEGYMALRRSAVAMFIRGITPPHVAAELGLDVKMMDNWNYQSRVAGRQIAETTQDRAQPTPVLHDQASEAAPRAAAAPEPPAPHAPPTTVAVRMLPPDTAPERSPAAAEVPRQRQEAVRGFWTEVANVPERGRPMAEQAAREMGLTLEEYAGVRRRAVALYRKGFLPAHVAKELKLTNKQASNWRDRMKGAGLLQFGGAPLIANDTPDDEHERLEA